MGNGEEGLQLLPPAWPHADLLTGVWCWSWGTGSESQYLGSRSQRISGFEASLDYIVRLYLETQNKIKRQVGAGETAP